MTRSRAGAAALACGLGVGLTAVLASGNGAIPRLDDRIIVRLHAHDMGVIGDVSRLVNAVGDPLPQLALAAGAISVAFWRHRARLGLTAAAVVLGADLTTQLLKSAVAVDRYEPAPGLVATNLHSFPSGHATAFTATTIAWLLVVPGRMRPPVAIVGAGLTALVGLAAVVLHNHWPSDVVGGVLVGCAWGFGAIAMVADGR